MFKDWEKFKQIALIMSERMEPEYQRKLKNRIKLVEQYKENEKSVIFFNYFRILCFESGIYDELSLSFNKWLKRELVEIEEMIEYNEVNE